MSTSSIHVLNWQTLRFVTHNVTYSLHFADFLYSLKSELIYVSPSSCFVVRGHFNTHVCCIMCSSIQDLLSSHRSRCSSSPVCIQLSFPLQTFVLNACFPLAFCFSCIFCSISVVIDGGFGFASFLGSCLWWLYIHCLFFSPAPCSSLTHVSYLL